MPSKKALLISINYKGKNQLHCAVTDLQWMSKLLTEHWNYPSDDSSLRILSDTAFRIENASNGNATRKDVLEGIQWLMKDCKSGDFRFIYFSGHGKQVFDWDMDEKDLFDEVIICSDEEVIKDDDLFKMLPKKVPAGAKLTAVFDCCHSGTVLDLPNVVGEEDRKKSATERLKKRVKNSALFKLLGFSTDRKLDESYGKTFMFAAGKDEEQVEQVLLGTYLIISKFTRAFVESVWNIKPDDTYQDILNRTTHNLAEHNQNPQLSTSHKINPAEEAFSM